MPGGGGVIFRYSWISPMKKKVPFPSIMGAVSLTATVRPGDGPSSHAIFHSRIVRSQSDGPSLLVKHPPVAYLFVYTYNVVICSL